MPSPYRKGWRDPELAARNLQIHDEYWDDGMTGPELAKKYNMNTNWIYTIVRRVHAELEESDDL